MKIVAVTSCTSGLVHTYLAKEKLENSAKALGIEILIETQGASGIKDPLELKDITEADVVLLATDVEIENKERFKNKAVYSIPINKVVRESDKILKELKNKYEKE